MQSMIGAALALAHRGMAVFPCWPRRKEPATKNGLLNATTDPDAIRRWWRAEPQFNVAIATGVTSRVFAIDVDGLDAEQELRRLEVDHGALPATVEVITARGRHAYFKMPETPVRNSTGKIAPGIDVRGEGGYTLAPPSVHPSGRTYCWSVDCASKVATAPAWLLGRIAEPAIGKPTPPSEWRTLIAEGVREGRRDNTLARITGYLLRHHIDPVFSADLVRIFNTARCTPPLPEEDVERIVNSIAGKELQRRQRANGQ